MLNQLREIISSFQKHRVKYVIIGGVAAILHGVPRTTFDLDILIEATPDNAHRLLEAMLDANLATASLTTPEQLLLQEIVIFNDRVRIDVQTLTPGISFEEAWSKRRTMEYQGRHFYVVSKEHLIASKRAAGRKIDLEDVRLLEADEDDHNS